MSYNPNIPQPTDKLSQSQPDILANFQQLNTIFGIDHLNYTAADVANRGKHMAIHMREQLADPTTAAQEVCFFSKRDAGTLHLYYRDENNGSIYPVSGASSTSGGGSTGTVVIGNIRLCWGSGSIPSGGVSVPVTFTTAFSGTPQVMVSVYGNGGSSQRQLGAAAVATTGFNCVSFNGTSSGSSFGYMAIGAA